jgi:hypothetical protein
MTPAEVRKALPEMVMFAKTEDEKNHYKKLLVLGDEKNELDLVEFANEHINFFQKKTF